MSFSTNQYELIKPPAVPLQMYTDAISIYSETAAVCVFELISESHLDLLAQFVLPLLRNGAINQEQSATTNTE